MDQHQANKLEALGGAVVEMVLSNNRYAIGVMDNIGSGTLAIYYKRSVTPATFQLGQIQHLFKLGPDKRFNPDKPDYHPRDRLMIEATDGSTVYGYLIREHENLLAVAGVVIMPNKYHRPTFFKPHAEIERITRLIVIEEITL
ncbi:MAG: hypothetical protein PHW53_03900 [Patescibacteria group bacterium]|nr:hypothetical protein [Patescibacteria group bacterium]